MLVNAPLRDQLNEPTVDQQPDENTQANCVPASLSAAVSYYTGQTWYGDQLKDAVYGQGYTGATDPEAYIPWLADHGVRMWKVTGSQDQLVQTIIDQLRLGHAVSGAIPSQWGAPPPADPVNAAGGTHEVTFCDEDGVNLTAMNPWPINGVAAGFYQTMPVSWWAPRIVYGRCFPMMRSASMWTQQADGWFVDSKGHRAGPGAVGWVESNGLGDVDALAGESGYSGDGHVDYANLPLSNGKLVTITRTTENGVVTYAYSTELSPWVYLGQEETHAALQKQFEGAQQAAAAIQAQLTQAQAQADAQSHAAQDAEAALAKAQMRADADAQAAQDAEARLQEEEAANAAQEATLQAQIATLHQQLAAVPAPSAGLFAALWRALRQLFGGSRPPSAPVRATAFVSAGGPVPMPRNPWKRSALHLNLNPDQRALLRLLKNATWTGILTAGTAAWQFVGSTAVHNGVVSWGSVNWGTTALIFIGGILLTIATTFDKYFTAHKEPLLGAATQTVEQAIQQAMPVAPAVPTPAAA